MKRDNPYEVAFEAFLRSRQIPYVPTNEARRALDQGMSIKNLDFIVSPRGSMSWLVDVKGRLFPSGGGKRYWTNWSKRDDLQCLEQWEQLFGSRFQALFVFAFRVLGERSPLPRDELFEHKGEKYAFLGVTLKQYAAQARLISPKWDTVAMSAPKFRETAVAVESLLVPEKKQELKASA